MLDTCSLIKRMEFADLFPELSTLDNTYGYGGDIDDDNVFHSMFNSTKVNDDVTESESEGNSSVFSAPKTSISKWNIRDVCGYFSRNPVKESDIQDKRQEILRRWTEETGNDVNYTSITEKDTTVMFELIDKEVFGSRISEYFIETQWTLRIVPNTRLTSIAGKCHYNSEGTRKFMCTYLIELATKIFLKTFNNTETCHSANGLRCCSRAECTLLVLEHEIIHLLIMIFCREKNQHGPTFVTLAKNLFGHTKFTHSLNRGDAIVLENKIEELNRRIKKNKTKINNILERDGTVTITLSDTVALKRHFNNKDLPLHSHTFSVYSTSKKKFAAIDSNGHTWTFPFHANIVDIY